ncbi:MAG: tryptophan--tRNA ligase [Acidobacteriota bacterium]|nr:tryptophan--tRNA ligase [Acidobacteriota bacterium]
MSTSKPVILSGIQPSGQLCIANYLGAIKNWVDLQEEYDCIFLVVDLHALTVRQVPAELRKRCLSFVAQYLACGLDPAKVTIAIQSHIPQHAELAWVLNTVAYLGELNRMTQFKEKSRNAENINIGLFDYPVLMAADILLYQTHSVPVGADQKQHLELTRDLAQRFNQRYSDTFTVPEPYIPKIGARVMSLQDPTKKMSKSDANAENFVALLDPPDVIRKKIKRAVTDSGREIRYDESQPGLANLMNMYSALTGQTMPEVEAAFEGKLYGELKRELGDLMVAELDPIRAKYDEIMGDKEYLGELLAHGAEQCRRRAYKTLAKVYRKVGFVAPARTGR